MRVATLVIIALLLLIYYGCMPGYQIVDYINNECTQFTGARASNINYDFKGSLDIWFLLACQGYVYSGENSGSTVTQKAKIFDNKKGLRDKTIIQTPLREFNAVSETSTDTVEELIEQVSIWVPRMYWEKFSINPMCIIILDKKINTSDRAEIRFGVALKCLPRLNAAETINI